jgi:hypothetical protein
MQQPNHVLMENFWLFYGVAIAWVLFWVVASAIARLARRKPIFASPLSDSLFSENRASGRSLKNTFTRIGGARNALLVCVSKQELLIAPHFPFSLMFLPEVFDLEHRVKLSQVKVARIANPKRATVAIEIEAINGATRTIELKVRDSSSFLNAVQGR